MELNVISGRLVGDVEVKESENGKHFAVATVAVYQGKDTDGNDRPAKYFNVIQFFNEIPTHFTNYTKGSVVTVTGKIDADLYKDKAGETRYSLKVVANQMNLENKYVPSNSQSAQTA